MQKRILIADDDEGIRDIFSIIFKNAGYSIELKTSGKDLLDGNFAIPHLFLLDKQLSGLDGLQICEYLKNNASTRHVPVIMVSASPDIGTLSKKAGADGFIEKPFNISDLLEKVEEYILNDDYVASKNV